MEEEAGHLVLEEEGETMLEVGSNSASSDSFYHLQMVRVCVCVCVRARACECICACAASYTVFGVEHRLDIP